MAGNSADQKILLSAPEAGGSVQFDILPECSYILGFAPETSTFEQDGPHVRIELENGAHILLRGFFPAVAERDITLELQDGTLISGRDFAEVLAMSLKDIHTDGSADTGLAADVFLPSSWDASVLVSTPCNPTAGRLPAIDDLLDDAPPLFAETQPDLAVRAGAAAVGEEQAGGRLLALDGTVSGSASTGNDEFSDLMAALLRLGL